jgi:hypothetical protein
MMLSREQDGMLALIMRIVNSVVSPFQYTGFSSTSTSASILVVVHSYFLTDTMTL